MQIVVAYFLVNAISISSNMIFLFQNAVGGKHMQFTNNLETHLLPLTGGFLKDLICATRQ